MASRSAEKALSDVEVLVEQEMDRYRKDADYEEAGVALLLLAKSVLAVGRAIKEGG